MGPFKVEDLNASSGRRCLCDDQTVLSTSTQVSSLPEPHDRAYTSFKQSLYRLKTLLMSHDRLTLIQTLRLRQSLSLTLGLRLVLGLRMVLVLRLRLRLSLSLRLGLSGLMNGFGRPLST